MEPPTTEQKATLAFVRTAVAAIRGIQDVNSGDKAVRQSCEDLRYRVGQLGRSHGPDALPGGRTVKPEPIT